MKPALTTPKKSLGQNFLINSGVLDKIVTAAELDKNDTVLEIGPGTGILTEKLAEKTDRVIAIEKDRRLIEELEIKFKNTNVDVVEGDVLKLKIESLIENCKLKIENSNYKVIGNIPYYITSHLLKTIFEEWPRPELVVLMVQKEVAQRIVAKPPHMNLLALSVQFFAEPKIISYVSKGSFRPMPKVDSAIIKLTPKETQPRYCATHHRADYCATALLRYNLFKLVRTAFAGKRKQLKNTIGPVVEILAASGKKKPKFHYGAGKEILEKAGIRPESRPEELSLEDWLKIASETH